MLLYAILSILTLSQIALGWQSIQYHYEVGLCEKHVRSHESVKIQKEAFTPS